MSSAWGQGSNIVDKIRFNSNSSSSRSSSPSSSVSSVSNQQQQQQQNQKKNKNQNSTPKNKLIDGNFNGNSGGSISGSNSHSKVPLEISSTSASNSNNQQQQQQNQKKKNKNPNAPFKKFVVHCQRAASYDVYVGRNRSYGDGTLGNPFKMENESDRDSVIEQYDRWLQTRPDLIRKIKAELPGKILACHCAPKGCHADVIARVANSDYMSDLI